MEDLIQHRFELALNDALRQQVVEIRDAVKHNEIGLSFTELRRLSFEKCSHIGYQVLWTVEREGQAGRIERQADAFVPATHAYPNGRLQFDLNAPDRAFVHLTLIGVAGQAEFCSISYDFQVGTLASKTVDGLQMIGVSTYPHPLPPAVQPRVKMTINGKLPGEHDAGPSVMKREAEQVSADGRVRVLG